MATKKPVKKNQDVGETLYYGTGVSELGTVLVASSEQGVVAVLIGGSETEVVEDLERRFRESKVSPDQVRQKELVNEVVDYIKNSQRNINFKVDLRGTPFQKKVWRAVRRIPLGQTTTYTALASDIGHAKAIRAVASACTVNPYAFVVPCHRVLHMNPALSFGHRRGNDRMRPMVAREREAQGHSSK